jgi:predicted DNA-binding transcriptional regulator AlpA
MSRRSRRTPPTLRQSDLFALPSVDARYQPASFTCGAEPREKSKLVISELDPEPQKQPVQATPASHYERRPSRETHPVPVHLLDVRAAAAWLGLSKSTLDKMRCYGVGPQFIRATGRAVRYDPADLAAFAAARRQSRTSDEVPA